MPAGTDGPSSPDNPARRGKSATIYCTGLGPVTNQPVTGGGTGGGPLAQTTSLPVVTVGGVNAQVSFSGLSRNSPGHYQVNFVVPKNAPTGGAVRVTLSIHGAVSNTATMTIE